MSAAQSILKEQTVIVVVIDLDGKADGIGDVKLICRNAGSIVDNSTCRGNTQAGLHAPGTPVVIKGRRVSYRFV